MDDDANRRHSPAAERNRAPILAALREWLPAQGRALEIASGSGQHAAFFAAALPGWRWQPSEADAAALPSIAAWCRGLPNIEPPRQIDVMADDWAVGEVDLVFCANLLHIAPWPVCPALMAGAARHLVPGGRLVTYGPYKVPGVATAPSNVAFDADLRARNPAWGLRDLGAVAAVALDAGLELQPPLQLPANNLLLMFLKGTSGGIERSDADTTGSMP